MTTGPGPGGRRARRWRRCCGCCAASRSRAVARAGVEAHRLAAWRDDFLEGGKDALKGQRPDRSPGDDRALRQAERKVGQLTMENEVLRAAAEKRLLCSQGWT